MISGKRQFFNVFYLSNPVALYLIKGRSQLHTCQTWRSSCFWEWEVRTEHIRPRDSSSALTLYTLARPTCIFPQCGQRRQQTVTTSPFLKRNKYNWSSPFLSNIDLLKFSNISLNCHPLSSSQRASGQVLQGVTGSEQRWGGEQRGVENQGRNRSMVRGWQI